MDATMATEPMQAAAPAGYTTLAKWFHWITVGLMVAVLPLGLVIKHVKDTDKMAFYMLHESIGLTIFVVVALRLLWRRFNPPPALDASIPRAMRVASNAVHHALYALLLAQPVMGFLATNAWGFPLQGATALYGVIDLPKFTEANVPVATVLQATHTIFGWSILGLLVLHIGGAVFHQAIRRDNTLLRMV